MAGVSHSGLEDVVVRIKTVKQLEEVLAAVFDLVMPSPIRVPKKVSCPRCCLPLDRVEVPARTSGRTALEVQPLTDRRVD